MSSYIGCGLYVPKARPLDLYAPLPETSALYLPRVIRAEPCCCGGYLYQHEGDSPGKVVGRHNQASEHQEWRQRTEAGDASTVVTERVDVSASGRDASGRPLPVEATA